MTEQYLYPVYETDAWHSLSNRDCKGIYTSKEEAIEKADQIEFDNNDFELDFESREVFESEDATSKGITV